jgi:epoxyqueuosine reductase QueG
MEISLSAAKYAPVAIDRVKPFMTDKMLSKLGRLPLEPTHAVMALFKGKVEIGPHGGNYESNDTALQKDCERLREEYPGYQFLPSKNAWPLPAVPAAMLAGLGITGLNGLLFAEGLGFALTIGAVLTDMPLSGGAGSEESYCPLCGDCAQKCPAGALTYAGGVREFCKVKCLSYLRQTGDVPPEREGYYGCDICQDVCPMKP